MFERIWTTATQANNWELIEIEIDSEYQMLLGSAENTEQQYQIVEQGLNEGWIRIIS